jgi:cell division protein FtsA
MFALGGRAFTKRIASVLGESFLEAESDKLDYSAGKLTDEKKEAVAKAVKQDAEVWLSGVQLTLEEFGVELLPSKILLCGGGSNLPDIEKVISDAKWGRNVPFAKSPTVNYLRPKNITSVVDETGELVGIEDVTPMALANLAIDLVGEEKLVDNILSKVIGTLRS